MSATALLVAGLLGYVTYRSLLNEARTELVAAYRAAEKDGLPLTIADAIPPLTDPFGNFVLYTVALPNSSLQDAVVEFWRSTYGRPMSQESIRKAEAILQLEGSRSLLQKLNEAGRDPCGQFDLSRLDYHAGLYMRPQHHGMFRWLPIWLYHLGHGAMRREEYRDAANYIRLTFEQAWALNGEASEASGDLRRDAFLLGYTGLQELTRRYVLRDEEKKRFIELLRTFDDEESLYRRMNMRFAMLGSLVDPEDMTDSDNLNFMNNKGLTSLTPFILKDYAMLLSLHREAIAIAKLPVYESDLYEIHERIDALPSYYRYSRAFGPHPEEKRKCAQMIAMSRLAHAGILLQAYRNAHDRFPVSLSEIGGIDFDDPFTGTPFLYKLNLGHALIYSIGQDMKDDGGNENSDIVWRIYGE